MRRYAQLTDILFKKAEPENAWYNAALHPRRNKRICLKMRALNELCFGSLEGLPGGKLRHSFPEEFEAREADRLRYRYPGAGGGSYLDMIRTITDVVLMTERIREDMIFVCDVAAARVL